MAITPSANWQGHLLNMTPRRFICGHAGCGREVGSKEGWFYQEAHVAGIRGWIYICPICHRPTFFDETENIQVPGESFGKNIDHLPAEIAKLYDEIRKATGVSSYTIAVLGCRKILMHIAVEKGAKVGLGFIDYVEYLVENHFAPPGSKPWVDKIRKVSNEANHEIKIIIKDQAIELVNFVEMLLKFIYEFPAKIGTPAQIKP